MALRFGTSGLRGLVTEMTPEAVAQYTHAFLTACDSGAVLCVGQDLRPSSPRIADNVIAAARQAGMRVINCGPVPTPALALAAQAHGGGAVMVTGSHIPADRNGLKFYTPKGEITKADEARLLLAVGAVGSVEVSGAEGFSGAAAVAYVTRYIDFFGPGALAGVRVGLWEHSSAARDVLGLVLMGQDLVTMMSILLNLIRLQVSKFLSILMWM